MLRSNDAPHFSSPAVTSSSVTSFDCIEECNCFNGPKLKKYQLRRMNDFRPEMSTSVFSLNRGKSSQGVALIVVLFAVALVSIVILAYFTQATTSRNISFSSAGQSRANLVALTALNFVKGDFIAEIQNGSQLETDPTSSGVPIYLPSTNAMMVPSRMTANVATDPTIPANLIKWSSGTYPLWPATSGYTQAGPIRASSVSTGTPSLNGHFIGNAAWTKPAFSTSTTLPTSVVPNWILLTRAGPSSGQGLPLGAVVANSVNNSAANNTNYVIGRYAYTVYDEGGLVDATAAGYSPTTFQSDPTDVGRKGSQGFADLTQLGLTPSQTDQLVNWRNAASNASASSYLSYLTGVAAQFGFLQAAPGDHTFIGRQDFMQYWTNELAASTALLPYLTTFSREVNAPSWGPEHDASDPASLTHWNGKNTTVDPANPSGGTISYAYKTNRDQATSINRFFPNVRVKTPFKRLSNEQAVVGEPLVKNRFDLAKLSWVTYNGVMPSGVTAADVYNYFGLARNSDGSWTYNHTSLTFPGGTATQTTQIMTLDQVASAGREPDFFEILQATILQGSLGLCSGDPTQATNDSKSGTGGEFYRMALGSSASYPSVAPVVRSDGTGLVYAQAKYQIIQIGANLIDQNDTDNFPTEIVLNSEHLYGDENLPYINALGDTVMRPAPAAVISPTDVTLNDPVQQYVHHWLTASLWNPHQNAAFAPTTGPAKIRISVTGGEEYPVIQNLPGYGTAGAYMGRKFQPAGTGIQNGSGYVSGPAWVGLNLSDYTNHFSEPTAIVYNFSFTNDGDNSPGTNMNDGYGRVATKLGWQRAGIYMGWTKSPDNPYKVPLCASVFPDYLNPPKTSKTPKILYDTAGTNQTLPLTVELEYEDTAKPGTWHTYQILTGLVYSRQSGQGDSYMEPTDPSWQAWTQKPTSSYYDLGNGSFGGPVTGYFSAGNAGPLAVDQEMYVSTMLDPRTVRFNFQVIHLPSQVAGKLAVNLGASTEVLVGADAGVPPNGHFPKSSASVTSRDFPNFWPDNLISETSYYTDRDFNVRPGDAAGWLGAMPWTTAPVNSTNSSILANRPIHLDRPFRSVAELAYVFRDDPWKTLNLFAANSADAGLLDVFYIGSNSLTAGSSPTQAGPDLIAGKMNIQQRHRE